MYGVTKEALEFHGNIAVKLEFYLNPEDYGYEQTYVGVPDFTGATYKGKLAKDGQPRDAADYEAWVDSLPRKWQLNPFHNHFIYLPPDYSKADVEAQIAFHLPNFYAAWSAGKTMRSGWATEKRIRPVRFDKVHPADYEARKIACLSRIATAEPVMLATDGIGKTFPATTIDVGAEAINRATGWGLGTYTLFGLENPSNDTGILDTIEIWTDEYSTTQSVAVATFYGSGTSYTARDNQSLGNIVKGAKRTITGLDIDVVSGDFLGAHAPEATDAVAIERGLSGSGVYYYEGNGLTGNNTFIKASGTISLYGTGETASVGARLLSLTGVGT